MTIIIVIVALLIAGVIAYFIFSSMNTNETTDNETTAENETTNDTSDEDVDVAGAYKATYNKNTSVVEDAADAVTDNDKDRVVVELLLEEDGTATFVKVGDTEEVTEGTYTVSDKKVILTKSGDERTDMDTDKSDEEPINDSAADDRNDTDSDDEYEFTINVDGSLSYREKDTSTDMVMLNKTDRDNLEHIK